jgi:hypothetical protein
MDAALAAASGGQPDETELTSADLEELFRLRYGVEAGLGPAPRMWRRFGYYPPDLYYEALVAKLVGEGSTWIDVGCGRHPFPHNPPLAQLLSRRCGLLVGVDPDATLEENPFVHQRAQTTIENFTSDQTFSVLTLRMAAEHILQPDKAVASMARLTRLGGKVLVFTVNQWSPVSLLAWVIPFALHHPIKRVLWRTEEKDTFPVAYQMNTRARLARLFEAHGFRERSFLYLDDCRSFFRFRPLHFLELLLWRFLKTLGLRYPDTCLLGVYERS